MSIGVTEVQPDEPDHHGAAVVIPWIALLLGLAIVVGALAAVFWSGVVALPSYQIQSDGSGVITENKLAQIVAADVWYSITGLLVGAGLGLVTWKWFRPLGWPSALLAAGAGVLAGLVCWKVGEMIGPGSFDQRLAQAQPGDLVPISLRLRAYSALAVWGFAAVTPVLLASSLGRDEDLDQRRPNPAADPVEPSPAAEVDDLGVLTAEET